MKRRFVYVFLLVVFFTVVCLPSLLPVQSSSQKQANVDTNNVQAASATLAGIFGNNAVIAVLTLVPLFGWGYIFAVLWHTGVIAASYSNSFAVIFLNPFMYAELLVYVSMTYYSFNIFQALRTRNFKAVLPIVKSALSLMVIVLFVFAAIEFILVRG